MSRGVDVAEVTGGERVGVRLKLPLAIPLEGCVAREVQRQ